MKYKNGDKVIIKKSDEYSEEFRNLLDRYNYKLTLHFGGYISETNENRYLTEEMEKDSYFKGSSIRESYIEEIYEEETPIEEIEPIYNRFEILDL